MTAPHTNDTPTWDVATMQTVAHAGSLGDAAARYAALGIPVFPCVPGAKRPLTPNGFHDATTSPRVVRDWWRRTPRANIGIPTGAPSGVEVVDIDVHADASGFPAFERARAAGGADTWGWLVRTPSGGLHAYYPSIERPADSSAASLTAPSAAPLVSAAADPAVVGGQELQPCWQSPHAHVDFRGDGGYIVSPPSLIEIDGGPVAYSVIAIARHSPRPLDATRLRRLLDPDWDRRSAAPTVARSHSAASGEPDARPDRLAAWVAALPEGGRNGGLFWAACRMAESGHRLDDALATVGAGGRQAGLSDREIQTTIASAYRTARGPTQGSTSRSAPFRMSPGRVTTSQQLKGIEL